MAPYIIMSETGRSDSRSYTLASLAPLVDSMLRHGWMPAEPAVVVDRSQTQADKDGLVAILSEWEKSLTRMDGTVGAFSYGDPRKDPKADDGKERRPSIPGATLLERVKAAIIGMDPTVGVAEGRRRSLAALIAGAIRNEPIEPVTVHGGTDTEAGVRGIAITSNIAKLATSRATPADIISVVLNYFNMKGASVNEAALMRAPWRFNKGLAQRTHAPAAVCFALGLGLDTHLPGIGAVRENIGAGLTEAWREAKNTPGLTVEKLCDILGKAIADGRKPGKIDVKALAETLENLPADRTVNARDLGLAIKAGPEAVRTLLGIE
jgi:hypothetical protein